MRPVGTFLLKLSPRGIRARCREPLPSAAMNAIVGALRLDALRTNWRRSAVIALFAVAATFATYKLAIAVLFKDENRPAGEEIVAALEAYKARNKRYPEKLAALQPNYLGKIPAPAPGTNFV